MRVDIPFTVWFGGRLGADRHVDVLVELLTRPVVDGGEDELRRLRCRAPDLAQLRLQCDERNLLFERFLDEEAHEGHGAGGLDV